MIREDPKETHTRIFISEAEARTQGLFSVGSDTLTLEQCKSPVQKQTIPQTFDPRDLKILPD
ncbi:hypothetical protein EBN15_06335 [Xanthomonas cucurbitae]|nr:hypothetical protein EBN15_06335 [Xanthomonas cucurbitae]